jgi:hypothetical protein
MSPCRVRTLLRRRVLVRVTRGVYARAELAADAVRETAGGHALGIAAALAVTTPVAAGSHQSAAMIHGLDLLSPEPAALVTLTRAPGGAGSRTPRPGIRFRHAALPARHVVRRQGVRVTSVARTVVDLARTSSFRAGVVTADSALRTAQASRRDLEAVLADCARWPGIGRARQVVAFSDARSESALESLSRVIFDEQGLPAPDLQVWVGGEGRAVGRADFLWRQFRTIGEADGAVKYADPSRAVSQLRRDARLREAGFEVVHFTWAEITRTADNVAASLRAAFGRGQRG